jgi:hypothetical protein
MKIDVAHVRTLLKAFDFRSLFREQLGWDNYQAKLDIQLDGTTYSLAGIAEKRGFQVYTCPTIPDRPTRLKLDRQVTKSAREHLIIYTDAARKEQLWEWVRREPNKPAASRDYRFSAGQSGDALIQKLEALAIGLEEEEKLTIVDVAGRVKAALDVDKVTKRFYDRFKAEHAVFMKFIRGIKHDPDLQWYTSLMLNRLMFVYFIQKKGFLDGDVDYLRNRLARMQQQHGKDKFYSFYRYFLLRLFHEGLGQAAADRKPELDKLLGKVPFLDGGFFEVHDLEQKYPQIDIPDAAFEKLFAFFDAYRWHLDERPLRADNEINPDVVGYIFEKYVNQKQMGAYYTKEDITEYISKNTIIPFLFDAAEKKCAIAFKPDSALWRLLRDDPDRYIYPAVRHGVVRADGSIVPESELPDFVQVGLHDPQARMHDKRFNLQQAPAGDPIRLVTETWREYMHRRQRCLEIREKLGRGEVDQINELITLNLDIWQFARDAIVNSEGPELLRAFYHTIAGRIPMRSNEKYERGLSVLDPTCGSGAFLFAALRILETLYADCLERMRRFVDELDQSGEKHRPEKYADFKTVLAEVRKHPNERYFVLKSIIINNLFGVDIMEEAVEICKLRLFLKLVAQVERVEQIEPLPDIDFNIRAGNTLVGYVSLDEVRRSQAGTLGFGSEDIKRIEEDALIADGAYKRFRETQVRHGGAVTAKDKAELRKRLGKLDTQLDHYLAGEYGIDAPSLLKGEGRGEGKAIDRKAQAAIERYDAWKATHQPFHWLVEFFGMMRDGGFDVIIGNPPYVEWNKVDGYDLLSAVFRTRECGNLYACMSERSCYLLSPMGRMGMIIPVSCASTERMSRLREVWFSTSDVCWLSFYSGDAHPSVLFPGVKFRLCIAIHARGSDTERLLYSGRYARWLPDERPFLFPLQFYAKVSPTIIRGGLIPKLGFDTLAKVLDTARRDLRMIAEFVAKDARHEVYCHRIVAHFMKAMDFIPFFRNERDGEKKSEDYKVFPVAKAELRPVLSAVLNSNLFYWYYLIYSDVYHCGRELILGFPCDLQKLQQSHGTDLSKINAALMKDLRKHCVRRRIPYRTTGVVEYDEYYPRASKPVIDEIDRVIGRHYGFSDEEIDFIINYDIKYRMGGSDEDE